MEALERAYRDTPARYSTAEIGLAQLRGGLQIVRGQTFVFKWHEFSGEDAIRLARRALPLLNRRTPRFVTVSDAVDQIATGGGVDRYLVHAAGLKPRWGPFRHYPKPSLLAMEMALFEEEERRAMEGELDRLLEAWREAEKLAAISDDLLPPKGWEAFREHARAAQDSVPPTVEG